MESDLLQLKLIHNTVVDTSVVFPHKMGLPFKRGKHIFASLLNFRSNLFYIFVNNSHPLSSSSLSALRNLMQEHLQKIIQQDDSGHDSAEDARSCLELMQWKVKADVK